MGLKIVPDGGPVLEHELERELDIVAGALFMERVFLAGSRPEREQALVDLYVMLEQFLARWRSLVD